MASRAVKVPALISLISASLRVEQARRSRGFTLIEILVVVVLIALAAAAVVVKLQPDDKQALRLEAQRLAALLIQARDEAITTGSALAWQGDASGYTFMRRNRERLWEPFGNDEVFRTRKLPQPAQLASIEIGGRPAKPEDMLIFSSTGVAPPFRIVLVAKSDQITVHADHPARILVDDAR